MAYICDLHYISIGHHCSGNISDSNAEFQTSPATKASPLNSVFLLPTLPLSGRSGPLSSPSVPLALDPF